MKYKCKSFKNFEKYKNRNWVEPQSRKERTYSFDDDDDDRKMMNIKTNQTKVATNHIFQIPKKLRRERRRQQIKFFVKRINSALALELA